MERPGNKDIQLALHANYGSNVERYEQWNIDPRSVVSFAGMAFTKP